jgi:serine/threonine-protein kinase
MEESRNIWLFDVERSTSMRFTFQGNQYIPCWTPNGDWLTFDSDHGGQGIYWKKVDGSIPIEPLSVSREALSPGSWSPDGTLLAYHTSSPVTKRDIWIWPKDGNAQPFPFANTEFNEAAPVFSPDGRFLAYVSDESGQNEIYVQPYPGPGEKQLVSTDGGIEPVWSTSGREFFYRHGNEMLVVDTELEPELRLGQPRVLFRGAFLYGSQGMTAYDVSPDGQRFVMVETSEDSAPTQFNVILNWHEELKKLVPSNE